MSGIASQSRAAGPGDRSFQQSSTSTGTPSTCYEVRGTTCVLYIVQQRLSVYSFTWRGGHLQVYLQCRPMAVCDCTSILYH